MKEKQINVGDVNINYFDNESEGFPVLMIHGNSLSASLFKNQFSDEGLQKYRLIAPDLPGHGKSGRSQNPEQDYPVKQIIETMLLFVRKLNLQTFVIFGHSLGGHIGINLLPHFNGCKGFMAIGTPPLKAPANPHEAFLPNPFIGLGFKPDLNDEEMRMLATAYLAENHSELESFIQAIEEADPLARANIGKSITEGENTDEVKILQKTQIKLSLIAGEHDKLINTNYINDLTLPLWKDEVIKIENASHSAFFDYPADFNRLLSEFIEETNQ